jgi:Ca2+/Na+ antiporter
MKFLLATTVTFWCIFIFSCFVLYQIWLMFAWQQEENKDKSDKADKPEDGKN